MSVWGEARRRTHTHTNLLSPHTLTQITPADIDDLVRETDAPAPRKKPKDWLPDAAWRDACAVSAHGGALRDLPDSLARADTGWRAWCEAPTPELLPLPDLEARGAVPPFARAAAVAALRRDRALPALVAFVAAELGASFAEAVPSSVEGALGDASPERPVLCLLSRGEKRGRARVGEGRERVFVSLSLPHAHTRHRPHIPNHRPGPPPQSARAWRVYGPGPGSRRQARPGGRRGDRRVGTAAKHAPRAGRPGRRGGPAGDARQAAP